MYPVGCSALDKLPDLLTNVETVRFPDCTYQLVVNVSMGYDPIVLGQIERLQIRVFDDDNHLGSRRRDFLMPFNIVRYIHTFLLLCLYDITHTVFTWLSATPSIIDLLPDSIPDLLTT